ncbi:MAG: T9SS type A sorting domain-containing protein [Fibrobacter sp.]|nr:T9SS type A sorting domain-containing protein [Fibrobacter sp.]
MIRHWKLVFSLFISLSNLYASSIEVSDTIKRDESWNADTVKVTTDITVANGVTLTIGAGTYVQFQGKYKLCIKGRLLSEGTKKDSIIFTAKDTSARWASILFDTTSQTNDTSKIKYCRIEYAARDFGGGICVNFFSKLVVSNSNITKNKASYDGGGVFCGKKSSPVLINNTISQNRAKNGGGVGCYEASPTIRDNMITNNFASTKGGGVYCSNSSSPTISGNTISGNSAAMRYAVDSDDGGGGVYSYRSSPTISGNTITANNSLNDGGGVYCNELSDVLNLYPVLTDNIISNDTCQGSGGGVRFDHTYPTLIKNTITGNLSWHNGGGICIGSGSDVTGNTISDNRAVLNGGGIYCEYSTSDILNNLISGNIADVNGGGVYAKSSVQSITNNIITRNSSSDGGGIYIISSAFKLTGNAVIRNNARGNGGGICLNSDDTLTMSNNTIANNSASSGGAIRLSCPSPTVTSAIIWNNKSRLSGEGQIYLTTASAASNFLYCNIQDSLSSLSGPGSKDEYKGTFKHIINISPRFADSAGGDFSLLSISRCINAGMHDTSGLGLPLLDIADKPRIFADTIDIGAYEFQDYPVTVNAGMPLVNSHQEFIISNFPNPFSIKTNISIRIPAEVKGTNTGIKIFNSSGRLVKTLYSGVLNSGVHIFNWNRHGDNGKPQPAGYYIVSLQSGGMKKNLMTLMVN